MIRAGTLIQTVKLNSSGILKSFFIAETHCTLKVNIYTPIFFSLSTSGGRGAAAYAMCHNKARGSTGQR